MNTVLQVSDPHFGTERPPVVEALLRLVQAQTPALVLLSGDITQRATAGEFALAQRFVARLGPTPVLAIPGNHDLPLFNLAMRAFAPYARYRRVFGPALERVHETPEWLVLGVDTTRRWRHEDGQVSAGQIERVARRLAQALPDQLRIVALHHPVAVSRPVDTKNLLHGRAAAIREWARAGADLILGGHIHLPFVVPLHASNPGLPRRLWVVQAGTAVSSRVRHDSPNSVNLIRRTGAASSCEVERWDYNATADSFQPVLTHQLQCGPLSHVDRD